jgi:hypothetical protein
MSEYEQLMAEYEKLSNYELKLENFRLRFQKEELRQELERVRRFIPGAHSLLLPVFCVVAALMTGGAAGWTLAAHYLGMSH